MTCSACSARIEKNILKLDGIKSVNVNLLTQSMVVEFDNSVADIDAIIKKVVDTGFGIVLKETAKKNWDNQKIGKIIDSDLLDNKNRLPLNNSNQNIKKQNAGFAGDAADLKKRFIISVIFTLPLFYLSMGEMMNIPLPTFFTGMKNSLTFAITLLLLTLPVLLVNLKYFKVGLKNIIKRSPNMDSLIAIGSGAAFIYGIITLYKMGYQLGRSNIEVAHHLSMDLYFESAAMILTLITLGKFFEARAKGKTSEAVAKLMDLTPKTAIVLRKKSETAEADNFEWLECEIPVAEIVVGDIIIVKVGDAVAVDGVIIEGFGSLDESAITGESLPLDKKENDKVTGGTINKAGYFKMRATAVGADTALSKIIGLVEQATMSKAPVARLADKISGIFVPIVITIALITLITWLALGYGIGFALSNAISVLVISCPCALGLATPTAIMVGMGKGATNGILIKSAEGLELLHAIGVIVLDKTGTITEGKPSVTDIIPCSVSALELLKTAASIENLSAHPFAAAIVAKAGSEGIIIDKATDYEVLNGRGISAEIDKCRIFGGNRRLMNESGISGFGFDIILENETINKEAINKNDNTLNKNDNTLLRLKENLCNREKSECDNVDIIATGTLNVNADEDIIAIIEQKFSSEGKTPLFFARDGRLLGAIILADTLKTTSKSAIAEFKQQGLEVIMLTGDNALVAESIRKQIGLDTAIAGVLPQDKEQHIRSLQESGKRVAMIGDGINDAPALARADVGIAIGAGMDIAIESADVVLIKSDLADAAAAINLSKGVMRNIRQNLFWAFIYNIIGIPVAAGLMYGFFGWLLNPMIAAAAMSFSSVSVVLNALRLRFFKLKKNPQ